MGEMTVAEARTQLSSLLDAEEACAPHCPSSQPAAWTPIQVWRDEPSP